MTSRASVRRVRGQARTDSTDWLSIRVDLVEGRGEHYWPRPGRTFAAARTHTFAQLATAIDEAFARWDRSHLHEFRFSDGTPVGTADPESNDEEVLDERRVNLSRLRAGERFVYVFDFGDDWAHVCTVGDSPIDPLEMLGIIPAAPVPYSGWGSVPDQYGRSWEGDDGESPVAPDPGLTDLPPLRPMWGEAQPPSPRTARARRRRV